jgi:HEPN domain-containing protein
MRKRSIDSDLNELLKQLTVRTHRLDRVLKNILERDYLDKPETIKCIDIKLGERVSSMEYLFFVNDDDELEKKLRPHIESVRASK